MATTKAASTKKATAKKPAAAKKTVHSNQTVVRSVSAPVAERRSVALPNNIINIVFAELVGTFILTLVALLSVKETGALYVGLAVTVLVLSIGAVSGAHINPAVTFGLWTMRRLKAILVPFYWGAQFLGSMLAVIVLNWASNGSLKLNFDHIGSLDWGVFGVELVATAIFLFGLTAAVTRRELSTGTRALGVGLSLVLALVAGTSMLGVVRNGYDTSKWGSVSDIQHAFRVAGPTVNPAVALAATESTDASFTGSRGDKTEKQYSRLSAEVVLGTLIGAALGGNLYLLVAGRSNSRD
ncbi:MAG: aquaporin [Candidatus Saccharimonas sp.]